MTTQQELKIVETGWKYVVKCDGTSHYFGMVGEPELIYFHICDCADKTISRTP
jgi:hypothetical protein